MFNSRKWTLHQRKVQAICSDFIKASRTAQLATEVGVAFICYIVLRLLLYGALLFIGNPFASQSHQQSPNKAATTRFCHFYAEERLLVLSSTASFYFFCNVAEIVLLHCKVLKSTSKVIDNTMPSLMEATV